MRIKGLAAKPELNGCGATVLEWNSEKERYAVKLDGSLKDMLLRTTNLERDKREAWTPAMHDPATTKHVSARSQARRFRPPLPPPPTPCLCVARFLTERSWLGHGRRLLGRSLRKWSGL